MFGQGRPHHRSPPPGGKRPKNHFVGLAWLIALASLTSVAAGDDLDVRVRVAWGGGEARAWQGMIRISEGTLSEVMPLGLEPDAPGSILAIDPATLRVHRRTPRTYDGCDVR